jgi:hypothetical protein
VDEHTTLRSSLDCIIHGAVSSQCLGVIRNSKDARSRAPEPPSHARGASCTTSGPWRYCFKATESSEMESQLSSTSFEIFYSSQYQTSLQQKWLNQHLRSKTKTQGNSSASRPPVRPSQPPVQRASRLKPSNCRLVLRSRTEEP